MALVLLPVSIIFIFLAYKLYNQQRFTLPPGPYPWPIIGNLHNVGAVPSRCFFDLSRVFGPIMSVWFGPNIHIVVSNHELAKQVLKEHDEKLAHRHRDSFMARITKNGEDLVWADYGPHYIKLRKICMLEIFSPNSLEIFRHIREDEVREMVRSIFADCNKSDGKCLEVRKYLRSVAFNHVTRMVFGKRFENEEGLLDQQGLEIVEILDSEKNLGAYLPILVDIWWLNWVFRFRNTEISRHVARKDRFVQAIKEEHAVKGEISSVAGAKQHFMGALLDLQEKYELGKDNVGGLVWDMVIAGMDTVAVSVEWAMAELIKNPRVQQKAQEELNRVIGLNRVMTESDISSLPYLKCVVKEALRLHPPTPLMLPHKANANVKIGGYDVPKGTIVHVNVWAIGRDPTQWSDPFNFRPERFIEQEDIEAKGHDFRLLPFGAGRRACPAAQAGTTLVTSMLGYLLHGFCWTLPEGVQPKEIDMSEGTGLGEATSQAIVTEKRHGESNSRAGKPDWPTRAVGHLHDRTLSRKSHDGHPL
ncbi:hypothetical protein ACFX13_015858 [Malus domestica]